MHVRLMTPEAPLFDGDMDMVVLPGVEGELGIMANHAPLMAALGSGTIWLYQGPNVHQEFEITSGFVHVTEGGCDVMVIPNEGSRLAIP